MSLKEVNGGCGFVMTGMITTYGGKRHDLSGIPMYHSPGLQGEASFSIVSPFRDGVNRHGLQGFFTWVMGVLHQLEFLSFFLCHCRCQKHGIVEHLGNLIFDGPSEPTELCSSGPL